MLFSYRQFEQTKDLLINQFQKQPIVRNSNDEPSILYQYHKLLDKIKFEKTKYKYLYHKKNSAQNSPCVQNSELKKCTTSRKLIYPKTAKIIQNLGKEKNKEIKKLLFQQKRTQSQKENKNPDFYLTSLLQINNELLKQKPKDQINIQNHSNKFFLQKKPQQQQQYAHEQNLRQTDVNLINLKVKIFELSNQKQYLISQIQQLEQSIRHFQRLKHDIQNKIDDDNRKQVVGTNSALQKLSNLTTINIKNKQIKQKLEQIEFIFDKQLGSIKAKKDNQAKKSEAMLEDTTEKILTLKYFKQKLKSQKAQINKLQQKNKYKNKRIEQSKKNEIYAKILLKISCFANFIKHKPYGSLNQLQKLKNFNHEKIDSADEEYQIQKYGLPADYFRKHKQMNLFQLTKQILRVYVKLTLDQQKLQQTYEQKLNQLQKNQKQFGQTCDLLKETIRNVTSNSTDIMQKLCNNFLLAQNKSIAKNEVIQKFTKEIMIQNRKQKILKQINEQDDKFVHKQRKLGINIIGQNTKILSLFQQKLVFFINKLIKYLEYIMQNWLKFDQATIIVLNKFKQQMIQINGQQIQNLFYEDCRKALISHFENWEQYLFFIEQIDSNIFVKKYITKQKLFQTFRRVIKTKILSSQVRTQKILKKAYDKLYQQLIIQSQQRIFALLRLAIQIIKYSSKFQVFIVNISQKHSITNKQDYDLEQKKVASKLYQNEPKLLKKFTYNDNQTNIDKISYEQKQLKKERKPKDIIDEVYKSQTSLSSQCQLPKNTGNKQKSMWQKDQNLIVDLILDYKQEINKITKFKK